MYHFLGANKVIFFTLIGERLKIAYIIARLDNIYLLLSAVNPYSNIMCMTKLIM